MSCMTATQTTSHQPKLTKREHGKLDLLRAIAANPGSSKADLTRGLPSKTRAGQYQSIGRLVTLGLVAATQTAGTYSLTVTPAGEAELAHWA